MNQHGVIQFRPPPATDPGYKHAGTLGQAPSIESMTEAFTEHCEDGGRDFLDHVRE